MSVVGFLRPESALLKDGLHIYRYSGRLLAAKGSLFRLMHTLNTALLRVREILYFLPLRKLFEGNGRFLIRPVISDQRFSCSLWRLWLLALSPGQW